MASARSGGERCSDRPLLFFPRISWWKRVKNVGGGGGRGIARRIRRDKPSLALALGIYNGSKRAEADNKLDCRPYKGIGKCILHYSTVYAGLTRRLERFRYLAKKRSTSTTLLV